MKDDPAHNWKAYKGGERKMGASAAPSGDPEPTLLTLDTMSPLDRIHQLTDENALLRTQLHDAQEQAKRDTETIARLAKDKRELVRMVSLSASELASLAPYLGNVCGTWPRTQEALDTVLLKFGPVDRETVAEYLAKCALKCTP